MDVGGINIGAANAAVFQDELCLRCQKNFQNFLEEFRDEDQSAVYKELVKELSEPERSMLVVNFSHVEEMDADLATAILNDYYRLYPYLCQAVKTFVAENIDENLTKKDFFVSFLNVANRIKVRELTSEKIGRLLRISGQVVRTHAVHPELVKGTFVCSDCNQVNEGVEQQFKYSQPSRCTNPQCENRTRFVLDVHRSVFIDFQKVRIQETQAELPRGNIPRSVEVILRAECVEQAQPGDRIDFTGTLIVVPDVSQLAMPGARAESSSRHRGNNPNDNEGLRGLKALGVRDLSYRTAFLACAVEATNPRLGGKDFSMDNPSMEKLAEVLTPDEFQLIYDMTQDVNLRRNLAASLYPSIYGCDEIKHGTLLMLFGGVPKTTAEGTTLRGDLNVCIVGDPSTAKSQVLKQIEEFLPRSVYTSGKASTSAGLTAAVVRDEETGEFVIEAGALMLADNGVCCIDEFDKMDLKDQVAIHEAMEQQTISIAKAGIKATLNARASILAAANPIGGRYERSKSLRQNINLSAPILSRFDLFFILVDECSEVTDYAIARQILNLHRLREESIHRKYSLSDIQRYIVFARMFKPKISKPAQRELVESYKRLRLRDGTSAGYSSWRITVRQLESLIRLSEATARMHCLDEVTAAHVKTAYNLLNKSIIRVEQPDIDLEDVDALAAMAEEDEEEERATQTRKGEESQKSKLSYEKYKRMANMLVLHLRQVEEKAELDAVEEAGLHQSELITWYLNEIADEINSEEELVEMNQLCARVVYRLIHTDNVLIQLDAVPKAGLDGQELPAEDPILIVHPNYVIQD